MNVLFNTYDWPVAYTDAGDWGEHDVSSALVSRSPFSTITGVVDEFICFYYVRD